MYISTERQVICIEEAKTDVKMKRWIQYFCTCYTHVVYNIAILRTKDRIANLFEHEIPTKNLKTQYLMLRKKLLQKITEIRIQEEKFFWGILVFSWAHKVGIINFRD